MFPFTNVLSLVLFFFFRKTTRSSPDYHLRDNTQNATRRVLWSLLVDLGRRNKYSVWSLMFKYNMCNNVIPMCTCTFRNERYDNRKKKYIFLSICPRNNTTDKSNFIHKIKWICMHFFFNIIRFCCIIV